MKRPMILTVVFLAASAVLTVVAMGNASGWESSEYMILALVPYWVLLVITSVLCLAKPIRGFVVKSGCITSFLMLAFTVLCYADTSSSSTGALIFLFAPVYLLVGGTVVFSLGVFVLWLLSARSHSIEGPRCLKCGYSLIGLPEPRCPECGTPFRCTDLVDSH